MPKDIESLNKARRLRESMKRKYGSVPLSVWTPDISSRDVIKFSERNVKKCSQELHKGYTYDKKLYHEFSAGDRGSRGKRKGLSTFPPDLVRKVLLFYSEENEIVLDPFAGHNSRMQTTFEMKRDYIGYDVSDDFMKFNNEVREYLLKNKNSVLNRFKRSITLRKQSSEHLVEQDESIDLIFTSPPYYNIEWYGDEKEQLGRSSSYEDFLQRMWAIINECYRVLKPNRFCIFNVNDFRSKNIYHPYHIHISDLFNKAQFEIWDIIIINWRASISACFPTRLEERRWTAKCHEYLIVGRKTDTSPEKLECQKTSIV